MSICRFHLIWNVHWSDYMQEPEIYYLETKIEFLSWALSRKDFVLGYYKTVENFDNYKN